MKLRFLSIKCTDASKITTPLTLSFHSHDDDTVGKTCDWSMQCACVRLTVCVCVCVCSRVCYLHRNRMLYTVLYLEVWSVCIFYFIIK